MTATNTASKSRHLPAPRALVLILATASAGAWPSAARAEDWATPGLDAAHSRLTTERSGARFADGRWSFAAGDGVHIAASPVVADGVAVTVDLEGGVRALRAEDGHPLWQIAAGSAVQGTPVVARGRVFLPTLGGQLRALRLSDGAQLWSRDVGGMTLSSPALVGGDLVVAAGFPQRHIVRISGATGELVWQSPPVMAQFSNSAPAVGGGLVVAAANGGGVYAFDADSGLLRWDYMADGVVHVAAPVIAGGRVYLAGGDDSHRMHAIELATGLAVAGWPVTLPTAAPDRAGTIIGRTRAVSSIVSAGGLLLLQTRIDDRLDTGTDGAVDTYVSRESVVALDPAGTLVWQRPLARAEMTDPNEVPPFFLCPSPAAFADGEGTTMIAAASSLSATVAILDLAGGAERGRETIGGAALASPVLVNGRLVVATTNAVIQGLASSFNHAPVAPIVAATDRPLDLADVTLRWLPAVDADAEVPTYELRIDRDGELLETWEHQLTLDPGATSTRLTASLTPGVTYHFALRARDPRGALSAWSAPGTFTVVNNPQVTGGDGQPASSLRDAIAAAQAGQVIMLSAGTYAIAQTLNVAPGVSIRGAGPGRTTLDVRGLTVGINFENSAADHDAKLEDVTVHGAETCVQVGTGSGAVRLAHVVVRDCATHGVSVKTGGVSTLANVTLLDNGTGVHAAGTVELKNSFVTGGAVGLHAAEGAAFTSRYNNLFDNQADYQGLTAGPGDLSQLVVFADRTARDLHLLRAQPTTDKGDPADAVGEEPSPNGGRINLGAYGGTRDAELTDLSTVLPGGSPGAAPTASPTRPASPSTPHVDDGEGGCAVAGQAGADMDLSWLGFALGGLYLAYVRRRRWSA